MGDGGYIKLYRKFLEHPFWTEKRVYSKAEAWIYLLYKARFAESKLMIDNKIMIVHRGEFVTSELKLSDRWNWSRGKVRRYLDELETEQMITRKRTTNSTTITLINYEVYQGDDTTDDTTNGQPIVQRTNIRRTTDGTQNKNIKKVKEDQEGKKRSIYGEFVSLTDDEHQKLISQYGEQMAALMIQTLDNYKGASGKRYKSDYRAILNWVVDRVTKDVKANPGLIDKVKINKPKEYDNSPEMEAFRKEMYDNMPEDLR
jgi:CTP-dependent riboflavin kinase